MITDTELEHYTRRALLIRARNDAALTALVPKANIDPDGVQPWPIILIEAPRMLPRRMACARGSDIAMDVHAFAGPVKSGGATIQTGRYRISAIGKAIQNTFAPNVLTLEDGSQCKLSFSDVRILKDQEPDHFHWFGQLNCQVLKAVA